MSPGWQGEENPENFDLRDDPDREEHMERRVEAPE